MLWDRHLWGGCVGYLRADVQARGTALIEAAGALATPDTPFGVVRHGRRTGKTTAPH